MIPDIRETQRYNKAMDDKGCEKSDYSQDIGKAKRIYII